jgi:iron complex transport system substrate-binding protein
VVDDFGRSVTLPKVPQRIVSLAPSNTEILFALGLGSKVVGVTKFCDYPPEVLERVKKGDIAIIGGFADPSIERIVALNPDLVLAASSLHEKVVKDLEEKGITVVALNPKKVDQILANIRLVGKVCGKPEEAENLTDGMRRVIDAVVSKTENVTHRPKVYYEVWYEPLYTIGPGTWQSELIEMAGGVNIFADAKEAYPIVSAEAVIERNPEIIVVPIGYMGGVEEDFEKRPGWSAISAVKNGKIYEIDENTVIRPGPRIIQGLQQLAKFIHSEIFGASSILISENVSPLQIALCATPPQRDPVGHYYLTCRYDIIERRHYPDSSLSYCTLH